MIKIASLQSDKKVQTKKIEGARLKDENEDSVTTRPILSHLCRTLLFIYGK